MKRKKPVGSSLLRFPRLSFSSEVGWNLAPFLRIPFKDRHGDGVSAEPILGTGDDLIELLGLRSALQLGLALLLVYPELGIHAVAVDYLVGDAFLGHQSEGVDDGEELADVVGAVDRTIVENLCTSLKVNALIFHWTGISGAGCIHSPGVRLHLIGQRQDCIVSP